MIHIVTLQRNPPRTMKPFVETLRNNSDFVWEPMPNVWLVNTHLDATELSNQLLYAISDKDRLLVMRTQPEYAGWMDDSVWTWLENSNERGDFDDSL